MTGRAGLALELRLQRTERESADVEVKEAITLCFVTCGAVSARPARWTKLIKLLAVARLGASEEDEGHIVRLLQDALDYAMCRILKPEFEERFLDNAQRSLGAPSALRG